MTALGLLDDPVRRAKRAVDRRHEGAPLQIQHGDVAQPARKFVHSVTLAVGALRVVLRAEHPLVRFERLEEIEVVPGVIASGHHIDARFEHQVQRFGLMPLPL